MKTAIIGGGAAGFFLAVNLKELMPQMEVSIFERSQRVLAKVEISGGGRCNLTNTFRQISDLSEVYPRGHRLVKRLFHVFDYQDAFLWFQHHGVPLVIQPDECVFPQAQDSHAVIDCFLSLAQRYHIQIHRGLLVRSLSDVSDYDFVAVATGGSPRGEGLRWLADLGHEIASPIPSLFSLRIDDLRLTCLQGLVVNVGSVHIPGTKYRAHGPLLITHWGVSGPAVLRLSSYAARYLADNSYSGSISICWTALSESDVQSSLLAASLREPQKQLSTFNPFGLPQRLWFFLLQKSLSQRAQVRWAELNRKDVNRLVNVLLNDVYPVSGRAPFNDEFVTCGGVSLSSVHPSTLESRLVPHLYFAGEVLDIDGVTGGFNFQAAWTTAYTVAHSISLSAAANSLSL